MTVTSNHEFAADLGRRFAGRFGGSPSIFRAPGRVNLIGEHTDYNDGFVMPAALEFSTWVAAAPRTEPRLRLYSEQFRETAELQLDALDGLPRHHWSDYVRGVAALLRRSGHTLAGADLLIDGQVPLGAGLSSSAALEVSAAWALASLAGAALTPPAMARLCQQAEHEFAGTRCGIMDQYIAVFGQAGHALLLDCRSLQHRLVPIPPGVRLVICNSMVRHALASGEYNRRREECEAAVAAIRRDQPSVRALRDVTPDLLQAHHADLPETVYRRARHVVGENARVEAAAEALRVGDLPGFGALMFASHRSLRDDYQVSCRELDLLVDLAAPLPGVYGARMTGGGFGGCTVNLVAEEAAPAFAASIAAAYKEQTGQAPPVYVCSAAEGAGPA